jgi:hypothetical protein
MTSPSDERDSGMEISFKLSIGYTRQRPATHDLFEARVASFDWLARLP